MAHTTVCDPEEGVVTIIKGESKELNVTIVSKDTGKGFDLTGQTEVQAFFENADDSVLTKNTSNGVTVVSEPRGEIKVALTEAETTLLKAALNQSFEIEITFPAKTSIAQVKEKFNVVARLFS